jgi:hypothetical protein
MTDFEKLQKEYDWDLQQLCGLRQQLDKAQAEIRQLRGIDEVKSISQDEIDTLLREDCFKNVMPRMWRYDYVLQRSRSFETYNGKKYLMIWFPRYSMLVERDDSFDVKFTAAELSLSRLCLYDRGELVARIKIRDELIEEPETGPEMLCRLMFPKGE